MDPASDEMLVGGQASLSDAGLALLLSQRVTPPRLLSAYDCGLSRVPSLPPSLSVSLSVLLLNGNRIRDPAPLVCFSRLTRLYLASNALSLSDGLFSHLPLLERLDVSRNGLRSLPDDLGSLGCLERLDVHANELVSLPDSLGRLSSLRELGCFGNALRSLPPSLAGLPALTHLQCAFNQLSELVLPASLESLRADGNQLRSLDVSGCPALRRLEAANNRLMRLDVTGCSQLQALVVTSNLLERLVLPRGPSQLRALDTCDNRLPSRLMAEARAPDDVTNLVEQLLGYERLLVSRDEIAKLQPLFQ